MSDKESNRRFRWMDALTGTHSSIFTEMSGGVFLWFLYPVRLLDSRLTARIFKKIVELLENIRGMKD